MPFPKLAPCLWFDNNLNAALDFYKAIFPNTTIHSVNRTPGSDVSFANFELEGQYFYAIDGGPQFKLNEAVSMFLTCADQAEVDRYWSKLLEGGGKEMECGWLQDQFGLCWQIVPECLIRYMGDADPEKTARVHKAMLGMVKMDIAGLEKAYAGQ